ncbi:MAG: hypothetical protein GY884_32835 [Proteobacteria bacterium]|nr:hypothetical protein [Pseudomonadota bacterium]
MRGSLLLSLGLVAMVACTKTSDDGELVDTAIEDTAPPPNNDADGDGILDMHDGLEEDADGDGDPNYLDVDSDGDGLLDEHEAGDGYLDTMPFDSDVDGIPDFLDLDSDNNEVLDIDEAGSMPKKGEDTDGDGTEDYRDFDNDGDEITDLWEITTLGSPVDTDGDGTPDFMDTDSDNDLVCDIWEGGTTAYRDEPIDSDADGIYDFRDDDSDNDGFSDTSEAGVGGGCPEPADTDGDGSYDTQDEDADGDGLSDYDEVYVWGTDPYDGDSDGDGQTDGAEIAAGTDPLDSGSSIEGVYVEVEERTSKEHVFEFEPKIQYGDIAFMLDTTGSMSGTVSATTDRFGEIVTELGSTFENVAFGLAQFDDYNYGSMGSSADKPFILLQQMTDSESSMQTALNNVQLHSGADGQESDMEALYQAATGAGYDQDCDGTYDGSDDIPPFIADSSDPFGGSASDSYDSSVSGTGTKGGFGFRDYSLPVVVYATDIYMRDPDYTGSISGLTDTPGGCPMDAGSNDVVTAYEDLGGYIIGIDVGSYGATSPYGAYTQMIDLAQRTNSYADLDGDGEVDDELVFEAPQAGSSFATELKENIVLGVEQLVDSVKFTKIHLEVIGDEYGMVESIDPEYYEDIDYEGLDTLDYTLNFLGTQPATSEDQHFLMTLRIIGDDTILLDELDIVVVVPGTSN